MGALPCCPLSIKRARAGKEWKSTKSSLSLSFRPMTMITIKVTALSSISFTHHAAAAWSVSTPTSALPYPPSFHLMIARGLLIGNQSLKLGGSEPWSEVPGNGGISTTRIGCIANPKPLKKRYDQSRVGILKSLRIVANISFCFLLGVSF